jgi:hypothetical protein
VKVAVPVCVEEVEEVDVTVALVPAVAVPLAPEAVVPAVPELVAVEVLEPVPEPWVSTPAAGRPGSVTSIYEAPWEPGSASTASAAVHFAASSVPSPK